MVSDEVARLLALRDMFAKRGDRGLVREVTAQLSRLGYYETAVPVETREQAVIPKRGPGRPRKVQP